MLSEVAHRYANSRLQISFSVKDYALLMVLDTDVAWYCSADYFGVFIEHNLLYLKGSA